MFRIVTHHQGKELADPTPEDFAVRTLALVDDPKSDLLTSEHWTLCKDHTIMLFKSGRIGLYPVLRPAEERLPESPREDLEERLYRHFAKTTTAASRGPNEVKHATRN